MRSALVPPRLVGRDAAVKSIAAVMGFAARQQVLHALHICIPKWSFACETPKLNALARSAIRSALAYRNRVLLCRAPITQTPESATLILTPTLFT
jgi:hypothetical protein